MAVLGFALAVAVAFVLGGLAVAIGPRFGVVDLPDEDLKPHSGRPVPLGGVGVFVAVNAGLAVIGSFEPGLFLATLLVWILGLLDDVRGLTPTTRLIGAGLAAVVFVVLSDRPTGLTDSIAWIAVVILAVNAVNLLDGLDALAGSVATVGLFGLGGFAFAQGASDPWIAVIAAGALVGFLFWNLPPAKVFLGDNGAYVVGVLLAWAALHASHDRGAGLVAVALIGVPFLDLGITVLRRALLRRPLFSGDRDHTYDRLHQRGFSAGRVAILYVSAQAIWMAILLAVSVNLGDRIAVVTSLGLGMTVVIAVSLLLVRSPTTY